jgi:hypothetical protein
MLEYRHFFDRLSSERGFLARLTALRLVRKVIIINGRVLKKQKKTKAILAVVALVDFSPRLRL